MSATDEDEFLPTELPLTADELEFLAWFRACHQKPQQRRHAKVVRYDIIGVLCNGARQVIGSEQDEQSARSRVLQLQNYNTTHYVGFDYEEVVTC